MQKKSETVTTMTLAFVLLVGLIAGYQIGVTLSECECDRCEERQ